MTYRVSASVLTCTLLAAADGWTALGSGRLDITLMQGDSVRFTIGSMCVGGGWKQGRLDGLATADGAVRRYRQDVVGFFNQWWEQKPLPGTARLDYELAQTGPDALRATYRLTPDTDMRFGQPGKDGEKTMAIGPVLGPSPFWQGGTATFTLADGTTKTYPLPVPMGGHNGVAGIALTQGNGTPALRLRCDPPLRVHLDHGEIRCFMGDDRSVPAGTTISQTIDYQLPAPATFAPANRLVDTSSWFPFDHLAANTIDPDARWSMQAWQDAPAGKHGWVQQDGDRFVFAGTRQPVKFWGVNPLKTDGKVDEAYLTQSAQTMAKYGINLARVHAFGKPNVPKKWAHMLKVQAEHDGLAFDERQLHLLDHAFSEFKKHGVYTGWSVIYGWYPTAADRTRVRNWDELQTMIRKPFPGEGSFYHVHGLLPDVQDLIIAFHLKLLQHRNPLTGTRYADDPALAFIELQNEENIFLNLFDLDRALAKAPSYRADFCRRFGAWLRERYADRQALAKAWGDALKADEDPAQGNVSPFPAWFAGKAPNRRVADQMHFLYTTQRDFYRRFADAVRKAGYGGTLVGSCWQASNWVGHLYNIRSDADIGHIDRHNYQETDLTRPGGGLLSAAFQAVIDRPFAFSEWDGGSGVGKRLAQPVMGIYGMGLHGWDSSMQFAWNFPGAQPCTSGGCNDSCNDPGALLQYPALARLVRRGDVAEGAIVANRRVSLQALAETGDVGFEESFSLLGGSNNKSFTSVVPTAALAAGRVVLEYVDGPVAQPVTDTSQAHIDGARQQVRSTTGQLLWDHAGSGFFTVDTPGTKALIGHAPGILHRLGDIEITTTNPYVTLYVSATAPGETIATAKSLILTALGRTVDRGTVFEPFAKAPLTTPKHEERIKGPVLCEPVVATITLPAGRQGRVWVLDHGGRRTGQELPVQNGRFTIDGAQSRTMFYEVERR